MEAQLHRTHGRDYDDPLHPTDIHEEERGGETKSTMKKVKEKVHKLKDNIKHGHVHGHHDGHRRDEAQAVNDSPAVRSGLAEPTVMGTPVLAEDLYTTHSDILDPPVRSFARWEEEEKHGSPPPLSIAYETHLTDPHHVDHHTYGQDVNKEESEGGIWKPAVLDEDERYSHGVLPPLSTGPLSAGYGSCMTNPPHIGHHNYGEDVNREELQGSVDNPTGLEEVERRGAKPPQYTGSYGTGQNDTSQLGQHGYGDHDVKKESHGTKPPQYTGTYGADLTGLSKPDQQGYGDQDVNKEQGLGTGMEESTRPPMTDSLATHQSDATVGQDVGITEVLKSFDKMKVFDEPDVESFEPDQHNPKLNTESHDQFGQEPVENPFAGSHDKFAQKPVENPFAGSHDQFAQEPVETPYTGSHDQFAPEPVEHPYTGSHEQFAQKPVKNPPLDTIAADPSNPNSSYAQKISSATSAIAEKATAVKDSIVSKLSPSSENKGALSRKPYTKSSFPTDFSHKVADTLSGTLGPVYEKVTEAGSSVMSKMQGHGHDDTTGSSERKMAPEGKGVTVKEYLVDAFKPGDDDRTLSEAITHALHRGSGKQTTTETTTIAYVIKDEGEKGLQDSGN